MPDVVAAQALTALEAALSGMLPGAVPQGLTRRMRVRAQTIRLPGIGGYIGQHHGPSAALQGRRVAARVELDVDGGNDADAQGYAASLAGQILGATRSEFAQRGIQRIRGVDSASARALAFDVDFEYVPVPDAGEGVIVELAINNFNNLTPYRTRSVAGFAAASLVLEAAPLADFTPVDDAQAAPAGAWAVSADAPPAIVQTAATVGGPLDLSAPQKAGAMLLWRPRAVPLSLPQFVLALRFVSAGPDGIGIVFSRSAPDDYFYFLASQRHGYHLFGRRRPAGFETLAVATAGFATGVPQQLLIGAYDDVLFAQLGEQRTLTATVPQVRAAGEIGLLTHGNGTARFTAGQLWALV